MIAFFYVVCAALMFAILTIITWDDRSFTNACVVLSMAVIWPATIILIIVMGRRIHGL